MRGLYLLSVWLHILSAALWLGGMLFLVFVLVPSLRKATDEKLYVVLIHKVGARFRWVGWVSLGLLFLTGVINLHFRGYGVGEILKGQVFRGNWGHTLAVKLTLFLVVLFLSVIHDFVIGPRATRLGRENPHAPESVRLNRLARWIGRVNLLLGLLIVFWAVALVRGGF